MPKIDISIIGSADLQKKLNDLADKEAKKVVAVALRKEAYRARKRIVANIANAGLIDTGTMMAAYLKTKVKSAGRRNLVRVGVENPTRAELGIAADDKYYYPYAVEFGHDGAEPHPFIRPAIDEHRETSIAAIGADIARGIEKAAKK